jgi:hypothetical protein
MSRRRYGLATPPEVAAVLPGETTGSARIVTFFADDITSIFTGIS